jgi:hypothetical protein
MKDHLKSAIAFLVLVLFLMLFEFWVIGVISIQRERDKSYLMKDVVKRGSFYFQGNVPVKVRRQI